MEKQHTSLKAYGGRSALSIEAEVGRENDARVSFQGAPSTGPQVYDWKKKIVVQCNDTECRKILAVLLGVIPKFEAAQHGPAKDKTFSIEVQDSGKFYLKVMQKNAGVFGVPVEPAEISQIRGLILCQLIKNQPWMSAGEICDSVRESFAVASAATKKV